MKWLLGLVVVVCIGCEHEETPVVQPQKKVFTYVGSNGVDVGLIEFEGRKYHVFARYNAMFVIDVTDKISAEKEK